jgi:putative peptidoglycan lipid II flippase
MKAGRATVAQAGGIMAASLILSRVLGYVRDIVATAYFGQTEATDAYIQAFNIPDLIFFLIAGGALSSAFIPVFTELLVKGEEDHAWDVFSTLLNFLFLVISAIVAAAWIFAPQLAAFIAPDSGGEKAELIVRMARILLPAQVAFFLGGLMFGTLYARRKFAVPGLGPNIYNLGIIAGAVFFSGFFSPGVVSMSWGATVGAFLGNIVVPFIAMIALGGRWRPIIRLRLPGVRKVFRLMGPVIFGLSLPGLYALLMKTLGDFYPEGVVTALHNSNTLAQAPLAIFGQAMALAAFPALSEFFAQGQGEAFRSQVAKSLRTVLFLALPAAALLGLAPHAVIQTLFQRAEFGAAETLRTAPALAAFALGVPFWCLHPLLMRAYFARQKPIPPIVMGTGATAVFLLGSWAVVSGRMPYSGLPLWGSVVAGLLIAVMLAALRRELGGLDLAGLGSTAVKGSAAALACYAPLPLIHAWWRSAGEPGGGAALLPGFLVLFCGCGWAYLMAARALKMPETAYLDRVLKRAKPS